MSATALAIHASLIIQIFRNALPPHAPNLTLTISDTYGFVHSDHGNLAAGRQRVALFGSLEPVSFEDEAEVKKCERAYLAGELFELEPRAAWTRRADTGSRVRSAPRRARLGPAERAALCVLGPPESQQGVRLWRVWRRRLHRSANSPRFRPASAPWLTGLRFPVLAGWLPLDLYRAAGKEVRSEREVRKKWPEPIQPEPELLGFWAGGDAGGSLFGESGVAEVAKGEAGRLVVQW